MEPAERPGIASLNLTVNYTNSQSSRSTPACGPSRLLPHVHAEATCRQGGWIEGSTALLLNHKHNLMVNLNSKVGFTNPK
jgi:hypothetical protein